MTNKRKKYLAYFSLAAVMVASICLIYGYLEARNIKLKELTFRSKDIPDAFVGKKIIFVSDIHSGKYFTGKDVARLVERINERNPDMVFIEGDNTLKDTTYSHPFFEEIRKLKSKYGVYTVLGNHDHWEDAKLIQQGQFGVVSEAQARQFLADNQAMWAVVVAPWVLVQPCQD